MALTKILNDENKSFQPVLTDKLVYDTKPTVNSFNGITSDAVARAIAGASGDVPAVTEADNGKVLTAVYDEGGPAVEWADAQGGGAEYSAGTGISISAQDEISVDTTVIATKSEIPVVPTVDTVYDATSTNPQAGTAVASAISTAVSGIEQVPSSSSADSGKVLTVDASGDPSWVTPSGGTQYSAGTGIDISAQNAISVDTTVVATQNDLSGIEQVPTVTSTDDGKVLTATYSGGTGSFAWAAAQGGSSDIFIADTTSTNEDVYQAFLAGKVLFYKDSSNGIYNLTRTSESTSAGYLNTDFSGYRASNVNVAEFANVNVFSVTIQSQNGHANSSLFSASITNKYVRVLNMPLLNGNAGKVLTVNSGATAVEWVAETTELPATLGTAGQVLTVNSGATGIEWATPSGGGSSVTIGTAPDGWQSLTSVCGYAPQGPMESVFGFQGSALTAAGNVLFDSTTSDQYGFVTPNYQSGYQDMAVYVVLFYPYSYNNTSFNDFVIGPSIGSYYSPYQVHSYNQSIPFTDEMKAFIASRQYPGSVGIGLYAGDKSESVLTKDNLCKFVSLNDPSTIANSASWVKVAGEYVNKINGMPAGVPTYNTSTDVGKVLTVTANGLAWVTPS